MFSISNVVLKLAICETRSVLFLQHTHGKHTAQNNSENEPCVRGPPGAEEPAVHDTGRNGPLSCVDREGESVSSVSHAALVHMRSSVIGCAASDT